MKLSFKEMSESLWGSRQSWNQTQDNQKFFDPIIDPVARIPHVTSPGFDDYGGSLVKGSTLGLDHVMYTGEEICKALNPTHCYLLYYGILLSLKLGRIMHQGCRK